MRKFYQQLGFSKKSVDEQHPNSVVKHNKSLWFCVTEEKNYCDVLKTREILNTLNASLQVNNHTIKQLKVQ